MYPHIFMPTIAPPKKTRAQKKSILIIHQIVLAQKAKYFDMYPSGYLDFSKASAILFVRSN